MPRASIYSSFMSPIIKVVIHHNKKDIEYIFKSDEDPKVVHKVLSKYNVAKEVSKFFDNEKYDLVECDDEPLLDLD